MAARTIRSGIGTYRRPDGEWAFGMFGEEVDVHESDVDRFDRLNPVEPEVEEIDEVEETEEVVIPEGDPTMQWTVPQIDAFAEAKGIDLTGPNTKPEKLEAIAAELKKAADAAAK